MFSKALVTMDSRIEEYHAVEYVIRDCVPHVRKEKWVQLGWRWLRRSPNPKKIDLEGWIAIPLDTWYAQDRNPSYNTEKDV